MADRLYRIESLGKQLGIGVAGSRYAFLNAVVKDNNSPAAPYCMPNELICCELGRLLRLPVPPGAIVSLPGGEAFFASLDFNLAGNSLPPVDVAKCVQALPSTSAGLLVFDIWVANCDRHPGNFSVDFLATPPRMNVFDHSHSLLGYAAGHGESRLLQLRDRLGISWATNGPIDSGKHRHCLLDAVKSDSDFGLWIGRIQQVPDFFIEDVCHEALPYGATQSEINAAVGFLKFRRDNIQGIIGQNRAEFTAVKCWSLFP